MLGLLVYPLSSCVSRSSGPRRRCCFSCIGRRPPSLAFYRVKVDDDPLHAGNVLPEKPGGGTCVASAADDYLLAYRASNVSANLNMACQSFSDNSLLFYASHFKEPFCRLVGGLFFVLQEKIKSPTGRRDRAIAHARAKWEADPRPSIRHPHTGWAM